MFNEFLHVATVPLVKVTRDVHLKSIYNIVLNCRVIRGNPMNYTYRWIYMSISNDITLLSSSLPNLSATNITENDSGTYFCIVRNAIGTGTGSIAISFDGN